MLKFNIKKILFYFILVLFFFTVDRIAKIYILHLVETNGVVNIYVSSYLNLYLIWNKGIAFGLLSFDQSYIYNFITFLIISITFIILKMIIKSDDYKVYFFILIFSGSLGNLFDRLYYSAVPDFIDFHINQYHWFIFNVADIFISIGVLCLILVEIFFNKKTDNENN